MRIAGIIAEYNPFHNGHIYHLEKTREMCKADYIIAVMSGNFTQRGEPAVMDKWTRARIAVDCGIDLVLELPFAFACNSAEYFARGAVGILEGLGCVEYLSFGSESGDIETLGGIAEVLKKEPPVYREALKKHLDAGKSFPAARELALTEMLDCEKIIKEPNNILAIEYLKANRTMTPVTINRKNSGHNQKDLPEEDGGSRIASASAIRGSLRRGELDEVESFIPEACCSVMKGDFASMINVVGRDYFSLLQGSVLKRTPSELSEIFAAGEGLENKLKKAIRSAPDLEALIKSVKSKRYTETRVRRLTAQTLIGLKEFSRSSYYARILGLNEKGAEILRYIKKKKTADIPVITNINKDFPDAAQNSGWSPLMTSSGRRISEEKVEAMWNLLAYDILANDMYNLAFGRDLYKYSDYVVSPYVKTEL